MAAKKKAPQRHMLPRVLGALLAIALLTGAAQLPDGWAVIVLMVIALTAGFRMGQRHPARRVPRSRPRSTPGASRPRPRPAAPRSGAQRATP